jgi:arabinofuranosyltransferase
MKTLEKENRLPTFVLLLFYSVLVLRNAWISDDAMITFRVIENFLAGYGLGYNPYMRVQVFTHPLWMFLISFVYFIERLFVPSAPNALFYVTLFLSLLFSCLAIFFLLTRISGPGVLPLGMTVLILSLSSGFIDFSTSGLENPLTNFLLVVFVIIYLAESPNLLLLSFVSSLITLNRMDVFVLVAPALLYAWWSSNQRKNDLVNILIGLLPMILWELFSLFYFGFPFPNTAYAKLNTGISNNSLMLKGFDYILNSINWDPILFFTIGLAGVVLFTERNRKFVLLFAGVMLYILYVIKIGGDFMSGRFLTTPLLLSVVIISNLVATKRTILIIMGIVFLLGAFSLRSPLLSSNMVLYLPNFPISDRNGIADERLQYFGNDHKGQYNSFIETGFRDNETGSKFAGREWRFTGFRKVYVADALGKPGYKKGPNIYVIDNFALSDPLLARLPVLGSWDIGHFPRELPNGYLETLETGQSKIVDPDLSLYYSKLQLVTAGRLSDWNRIIEIWKFNTGQYDYLLERYKQHLLQV